MDETVPAGAVLQQPFMQQGPADLGFTHEQIDAFFTAAAAL
jgi:hypothetical protein